MHKAKQLRPPKLPAKARINGRWWKLEVVDELEESTGLCIYNFHTIKLLKGEDFSSALLHELIHASCPSLSEKAVAEVERGLFATLSDNPFLLKWIFGSDNAKNDR